MKQIVRFKPHTIPAHTHPVVQEFFRLRNIERAPLSVITKQAGLGRDTIQQWTSRATPNVANLDAALNVLGYRLAVVKNHD